MGKVEGYTNSQTWEAWSDSFGVLWDNTEVIFILSVTLSIGAVIYTWMKCSTTNVSKMSPEEGRISSKGSAQLIKNGNGNESSSEGIVETRNENPSGTSSSKKLVQEIEKRMSGGEKEEEREAQNKQLEAIFKLMQAQKEKFGDTSFTDIQDQMKFYAR